MRSIAIINQKGGVGKTTTAVNLAAALAESGARVCVLDLDPQSHASLHLGVSLRENDLSIYDVLTGDTTLAEVRRQVSPRLWIVPAHLNLAAAEMELAGEVGREVILRDKLARDLTVASERAAAGESPAVGESRGREAVAPDDGTEFDYFIRRLDVERPHGGRRSIPALTTSFLGVARAQQAVAHDRDRRQSAQSHATVDRRRALHVRVGDSPGDRGESRRGGVFPSSGLDQFRLGGGEDVQHAHSP
jgi:hypothetical protein